MTAQKIYGDTPEQRERVRKYIARVRPEMNTQEVVANGKGSPNTAPSSLDRVKLETAALIKALRFLLAIGK